MFRHPRAQNALKDQSTLKGWIAFTGTERLEGDSALQRARCFPSRDTVHSRRVHVRGCSPLTLKGRAHLNWQSALAFHQAQAA